MLAEFLRKLGDALTSLVAVIPGIAAAITAFLGKGVAALADVAVSVTNGVSELLDKVADYLNGAFAE